MRPLLNKNKKHRIYSWLQVLDSQLYYEDLENTEVVLRQDPQLQGAHVCRISEDQLSMMNFTK